MCLLNTTINFYNRNACAYYCLFYTNSTFLLYAVSNTKKDGIEFGKRYKYKGNPNSENGTIIKKEYGMNLSKSTFILAASYN